MVDEVRVITIPVLSDNYAFLVVCKKTRHAAVVDPAEAGSIIDAVKKDDLVLQKILLTHHHYDHTGGVGGLCKEFTSLEVIAHRQDAPNITGVTKALEDGDSISVGNLDGAVIHTPGHTKGGACYLFGNRLFTGDTLFLSGCGRIFEGTAEQMFSSLVRLAELPGDTMVYCGHEYSSKNLAFAKTLEPGNKNLISKIKEVEKNIMNGRFSIPSTISEELTYNPFLRSDSEEIRKNLRERDVNFKPTASNIFSAIRKLKDSF